MTFSSELYFDASDWGSRSDELPASFAEFIRQLSVKSPQTVSHLENVAQHSHHFVEYLHTLSLCKEITLETAYFSGMYHDLGKFFLTDIINLDRRLNETEYDLVKIHPIYSSKIAEKYEIDDPLCLDAMAHHHEDYAGDHGYPTKTNGEKIPLIARIIAIVDVYEALYSIRSYKSDLPYSDVKRTMSKMQLKFDPHFYNHFFDMMDQRILTS